MNILPRKKHLVARFCWCRRCFGDRGGPGRREDEGSIANFVVVFCDITDILSPYRCTLDWTDQAGFFPRERSRPTTFCYNSSLGWCGSICAHGGLKNHGLGSKNSMIFFQWNILWFDRLFTMRFGKILNIHKTNETQTMIFLPIMPTYKIHQYWCEEKEKKRRNRFWDRI